MVTSLQRCRFATVGQAAAAPHTALQRPPSRMRAASHVMSVHAVILSNPVHFKSNRR